MWHLFISLLISHLKEDIWIPRCTYYPWRCLPHQKPLRSVEGMPISVTCRQEMGTVGHCNQAFLPHTALSHSNGESLPAQHSSVPKCPISVLPVQGLVAPTALTERRGRHKPTDHRLASVFSKTENHPSESPGMRTKTTDSCSNFFFFTVQTDLFKIITKKHNKIETILRIITALLRIR